MVKNHASDCKIKINFSQNWLAEIFLDHHISSPHNPDFTKPSILFSGHFSPIEPTSRQLCWLIPKMFLPLFILIMTYKSRGIHALVFIQE